MELIYVWIEEYECIHRQGFCLSPEFTVKEWAGQGNRRKLEIIYSGKDNLFREDPIVNLTVLAGENGSGKTTFLEYVHEINCYPKEFLNGRKNRGNNVTVVRSKETVFIFTNIPSSEIEIECHVSPLREHFVDRSQRGKMAGTALMFSDYFCEVTKFHITNSYYSLMNGSSSHKGLDSLVFSPGALTGVAGEFFQFICPERYGGKKENLFQQYSGFLRDRKSSGEFQQLCDVLFYCRLIERKALKDYAGFVQTDLIFRICPVFRNLYDMERHQKTQEEKRYFQEIKEQLDRLSGRYDKNQGKQSPIYILKTNFIAEYSLAREDFLDRYPSDSIEDLFRRLRDELDDGTGGLWEDEYRSYFQEAYDEICKFRDLMDGLEPCVSQMWMDGGGDKTGLKVSLDLSEEDLEDSKYARICRFLAERISDNQGIRRGKKKFGSFVLRYIIIDNLLFSSGERAFQNLMSWMSFGAELSKAVAREDYVPRTDILLCIDEADLYCHPSWQRDFIDNLLMILKKAYEGYSVQIIMTTHSPLCLSDVPRENIIYLKNEHGNTVVDQEWHRETFGCNLYELLNDAFYLRNQTMGKFAQRYINSLIREINNHHGDLEQKIPELRKRIGHIGDSFLRRKLEQQLEWQWQKQMEERRSNITSDDERLRMLEEEKERIERQIEALKGKNE